MAKDTEPWDEEKTEEATFATSGMSSRPRLIAP